MLVVELLGRSNGVGFQIYTYFQFFDVRAILGYSLAFVAVMLLVEMIVVQPLERQRNALAQARCLRSTSAPNRSARRAERKLPALGEVGFTVAPGEFVCLTGPSGCGKTTTLKLILGLDTDFEGSIRRPSGRIAAVFQEPRLLPWRSVEENVRLALPEGACVGRPDAAVRIARAYRLRRGSTPASCRSAWRVASHSPAPLHWSRRCCCWTSRSCRWTTRRRSVCARLLMSVWSARPTAALMVTHNLREAAELADRIVLLSERPGHVVKVVSIDTPRGARDAATIDRIVSKLRPRG